MRSSGIYGGRPPSSLGRCAHERVVQRSGDVNALPLAALHAVTGVSAVGGAIYALGGAPDVPTDWLAGSPFDSYVVPGLILGGAVAGSQLAAAVLVARDHRRARAASLGASGTLLAWIGAQVAVIGLRSPLQPLMAGVALTSGALALRDLRRAHRHLSGSRG
jgi:hypothetical protein